jgi:hypothetical protein
VHRVSVIPYVHQAHRVPVPPVPRLQTRRSSFATEMIAWGQWPGVRAGVLVSLHQPIERRWRLIETVTSARTA